MQMDRYIQLSGSHYYLVRQEIKGYLSNGALDSSKNLGGGGLTLPRIQTIKNFFGCTYTLTLIVLSG